MTPHRSAPGRSSKASLLDFMILTILKKNINLYGEEHYVQSHMLRTTITDLQDKYCGDCYDTDKTSLKADREDWRKGGGLFLAPQLAPEREPQLAPELSPQLSPQCALQLAPQLAPQHALID